MRAEAFFKRVTRGMAGVLLALAAPLTLAACTPTTYAGPSLRPGAADAEPQSVARREHAGEKHAQLEMGIRYEEGRGAQAVQPSVSDQAFADLIILDFAFERCVREGAEQLEKHGGSLFQAIRGCLHSTSVEGGCDRFRHSVAHAAELVADRQGLAALSPAAVRFLNKCPEARALGSRPAPTERKMTVIELLLRRPTRPDPLRPFYDASSPPAQFYVASLCPQLTEGGLPDHRVSELLLCSDQDQAGGEIDSSRTLIRRLLQLRAPS
jgi:hypothetical protein